MNPLSLRAENFRSYRSIELDFPTGAIAISGPNGAGKSSLIAALDVALFGARSLGDYLSEDADSPELLVELVFEHAGETYRVRRTYSAKGRGKSTTDLERLVAASYGSTTADDSIADVNQWEPITAESQAATQEAIEEILGLSRETFHASALLMQGDAGAFTEAKPAERKRILGDVLGLAVWPRMLEALRADVRKTEREEIELAGRISVLEERSGDLAELEASCSRLREILASLEEELASATAQLEDAALAVQAQETAEATYRERVSAVEAVTARLASVQAIVDRAAKAKLEAVEVQREIAELPSEQQMQKATLDEVELRKALDKQKTAVAEWSAAKSAHEAALMRRAEMLGRASELNEAALDLRQQADSVLSHVGEAHCDRCEQILGAQAADAAAASLRSEADAKDAEARELDRLAGEIEIPELGEEPVLDATLAGKVAQATDETEHVRARYMQRARCEERLAALQATIDDVTPDVVARVEAENVALEAERSALAMLAPPEPGALSQAQAAALAARGRLADVQAKITQGQAELATANARREQAAEIAEELVAARSRREALQVELELLALLERAYGRDGIPSLIVEASAIPQIEAEANRILAELGIAYRVELRTQRELKSGDGLADTLDVVVVGDVGARPYETFSGGERSRLNVALRIALARLLAHRRGAESRLLCLDEVEYLDAPGQMALAGVLTELARSEFDRVITVSHADSLREMFDTTIVVEKVDGRSRIAA